MQLSNHLIVYLGNVHAPYSDSKIKSKEKVMLKVLEVKCSHGRLKGFDRLLQHMAESDNPIVKEHLTFQTFDKWITNA